MHKKNTAQSSIGKWLNEEAHHKNEPSLSHKKDEPKKAPKATGKPAKKK